MWRQGMDRTEVGLRPSASKDHVSCLQWEGTHPMTRQSDHLKELKDAMTRVPRKDLDAMAELSDEPLPNCLTNPSS